MRDPRFTSVIRLAAVAAAVIAVAPVLALAQSPPHRLPVLVPVTGFLALEGTSQRNGALLALKTAPG